MELLDSQDRILDATIKCLARNGIAGATMRNVADEAGVSLGLLTYHFKDKQEILVAALQRSSDRHVARAASAEEKFATPEGRLIAYIRAAFDQEFLAADYLTLLTSLWALARTNPEIEQIEQRLYQRFVDGYTERILALKPQPTSAEAERRAIQLMAITNGLTLNWARQHNQSELESGLGLCEHIALGRAEQRDTARLSP